MATIINLTCKHCDNVFSVKKGREKQFCSIDCKSKHRVQEDGVFYVETCCEYCGKMFKSKKKFNKKFCSYKCSGLNKKLKSRESRHCLVCGELFIERIKHERKFCSETCRKIWQNKPENIINRLNKSKEGVLKKYGVENTFQVDKIRLRAVVNMKKSYQERGNEIPKNGLLKIKTNREEKLIKRLSEKGYLILEFKGENMKISHPDGHVFEDNRKLIVNRLNHNVELSTILLPIGSSRTTFELKICKLLKDNCIDFISNDRKTIDGELDINILSHKLAIEINGLHWHCEYYLNNDYHLNKTNKCIEKDIQLLHFFEDELIEKYNIIESIIKNKIGVNKIMFVDDCNIKEIDTKTASEFLKNNHIQGNVNASIKIGLFLNDELLSIMTFGKLRNVFGNKKKIDNEYEMLRYCDKLNTQIIGSAEKLYLYFKKNYKPNSVVGFANKRFGNDDFYNKLGFKHTLDTIPNYWYVVGKKRIHRFLFRKNILINDGFDVNKSEHQIMIERKIPRIYDCGNTKYVDSCD